MRSSPTSFPFSLCFCLLNNCYFRQKKESCSWTFPSCLTKPSFVWYIFMQSNASPGRCLAQTDNIRLLRVRRHQETPSSERMIDVPLQRGTGWCSDMGTGRGRRKHVDRTRGEAASEGVGYWLLCRPRDLNSAVDKSCLSNWVVKVPPSAASGRLLSVQSRQSGRKVCRAIYFFFLLILFVCLLITSKVTHLLLCLTIRV